VSPGEPRGKVRERYVFDAEFVAPRNAFETTLAEIWREVLGADRLGVNDSIFDFNADSILAAQAAARIRQQLGLSVTIRTLFEAESVAQLAELLKRSQSPTGLRALTAAPTRGNPTTHGEQP
jgi:enterobactin synthetase component F